MGADGALVGRETELAAIAEFLRRDTGGGLVLLGESGLGKSALWHAATRLATELGMLTLVATPGEGEESFSGSVLIDLLQDVDLDPVGLGPPLRDALDAVLLRREVSTPPAPQAVYVAVRDVLTHLAAERDLVVLVDDAQWADASSMEALAFAARRVGRERVRFVMTRRSGFERTPLEGVLVRSSLDRLEPSLLGLDETARLLQQHLALAVTPRVLRMVHELARGNPLFTLEVGRVLAQRGVPGIGEPLEVPEEMASVLGVRVQELPEEHRTLLLAVALDPLVREESLVALVGLEALESALAARLVTIADRGRVRAWHPLLAAAARESAAPARQRELHLRLARLESRPGAQARHLALGVEEPDEALAAMLAEESAAAAARGAVETSVELAELALARTPDDSGRRPERVLDLAFRLAEAAEGHRLTAFLEGEIDRLPVGRDRGRACLMLLDGVVGSMDNVGRIIDRAIAECGDDPEAVEVRAQALDWKALNHVGMLVAGVPEAMVWAEESLALGRTSGAGRDWCLVHSGRSPEGPAGMPERKRAIWRGEPGLAEPWLVETIASCEAEGRFRPAMSLRIHHVDLLLRSGRLAEAQAALAVLDDADLAGKESPDEEVQHALVEALTGDVAAARDWAGLALRRSEDFGHVWLALEARRATAIAALVLGELDEAEALLRGIWEHVVAAGVQDPGIFPVAPELAETLVLLGRGDDARAVLAWLEERATEQQHPWGLAMHERVIHLAGLVEDTMTAAEATDGMQDAAARLDALGLRHDAARTRLALGGALRRRRQWGGARAALEAARDGFAVLGASGWAELAALELAKVGGRQKRGSDELTPAEQTTARLAADGLSNKEIARRTGVSINTVEAHLTRAYAKLGVRSRSQLAARLAAPQD